MVGVTASRRVWVVAASVGAALIATVAVVRWSTDDPFGGAVTGSCQVTRDAGRHAVARLRLTDHGPAVEVGRIAVGFADGGGHRLPSVAVAANGDGTDELIAHAQARTFLAVAPAEAVTCQFRDWAGAEATTWGGPGTS